MLHDVEVAGFWRQRRVHFGAPGAELEHSRVLGALKNPRVVRKLPIVRGKPNSHEADPNVDGAGLAERCDGIGDRVAARELWAVSFLAVRPILVYRIVDHVDDEIQRVVYHREYLLALNVNGRAADRDRQPFRRAAASCRCRAMAASRSRSPERSVHRADSYPAFQYQPAHNGL